MITLLSPSKSMHVSTPNIPMTQPLFHEQTAPLLEWLQSMSEAQLASILQVSDAIAALNYQRYQGWDDMKSHPALWLYAGDVYNGFQAETLSSSATKLADEHLAIISGLYGTLRPRDAIKPYRLEMKLSMHSTPLSRYWRETVVDYLTQHTDTILICASREYASLLGQPQTLKIITPRFMQLTPQGLKEKGLFAKYARGRLARWVVDNAIDHPDDIHAFNEDGFEYSKQHSTPAEPVFIVPHDFSLVGRFTRDGIV